MNRVLMVVTETPTADELASVVSELDGVSRPPEVFIVVPARETPTPPRGESVQLLTYARRRMSALGFSVDGRVGAPDAMVAVEEVVVNSPTFDRVLVIGKPSIWRRLFGLDLARQLERRFRVPTNLVGPAVLAPGESPSGERGFRPTDRADVSPAH